MKKGFLILVLFLLIGISNLFSQNVAINATGSYPDTSAMLDLSSTTRGFLAPRMTTTQQNAIVLPANGLLIFNTTDNVFKVNTGTTASPVWTALTQTFATGTSGTDFNISTSGSVNTFNIPDASATARGLITTGTQTIAGAKTFSNNATFSGTITASTLNSGASTDSVVTVNSSGVLNKRNINALTGFTTGEQVVTVPSNSYTFNDLSINNVAMVTFTQAATYNWNLTGIQASYAGQMIILFNDGLGTMTLKGLNSNSASADQMFIAAPGGSAGNSNQAIPGGGSAILVYSGYLNKWTAVSYLH